MSTRLGQNFLRNKQIVDKIIKAANVHADDCVLEIGPGRGILTEELAKKARKVIAVELDGNLVAYLREKFDENNKCDIVEGDILRINIVDLISNFQFPISDQIKNSKLKIQNFPYKVIANLPYYITSPIIRMFLETELKPGEMILMVQKEVAERIVAGPGDHSLLSLSVQYYAAPEILFLVGKENFDPIPEVDSAVIKIMPFKNSLSESESHNFFKVVRAGFCAKRKTLVNNLSNSFHLNKKEVEEKIKTAEVDPTARAQELSIEEWKKLSDLFS